MRKSIIIAFLIMLTLTLIACAGTSREPDVSNVSTDTETDKVVTRTYTLASARIHENESFFLADIRYDDEDEMVYAGVFRKLNDDANELIFAFDDPLRADDGRLYIKDSRLYAVRVGNTDTLYLDIYDLSAPAPGSSPKTTPLDAKNDVFDRITVLYVDDESVYIMIENAETHDEFYRAFFSISLLDGKTEKITPSDIPSEHRLLNEAQIVDDISGILGVSGQEAFITCGRIRADSVGMMTGIYSEIISYDASKERYTVSVILISNTIGRMTIERTGMKELDGEPDMENALCVNDFLRYTGTILGSDIIVSPERESTRISFYIDAYFDNLTAEHDEDQALFAENGANAYDSEIHEITYAGIPPKSFLIIPNTADGTPDTDALAVVVCD